MSIVFKYQKHRFILHVDNIYSCIYIVNVQLAYGLTFQQGQIAMTPNGEILGWRFQGDVADRDFHSSCDVDVEYSIKSVEDRTGSYFEITGSTLANKWDKCYVRGQVNCKSDEDCRSYNSLATAIASVERELNMTVWQCETYQI